MSEKAQMNRKSTSRFPIVPSVAQPYRVVLKWGLVVAWIVVSAAALPSYAQERSTRRLIPRKALFKGFERTGFQSDPNGRHLFFTSTESATQIQYIDVLQPKDVNILETEKLVLSWRPAVNGVLFVYQEDGSHKIGLVSLQGSLSTFEPGFQINTAAILKASPINENHCVLSIHGQNDADSAAICPGGYDARRA